MNRAQLVQAIQDKRSFLCVGLDPDIDRIPLKEGSILDRMWSFNKAIIDATQDHCVAYKPNMAFYEMYGAQGWELLERTVNYIPKTHFIIADAKRGDIGNTSKKYAAAFFKNLNADAITVAPYMGIDSVNPFMNYKDKWVVILALTSNRGSGDFQQIKNEHGELLYETVLKLSQQWGNAENTMYVVGATHPEEFENIRRLVPDHFILVPGVGAQGGDLQEVCRYGLNRDVGLLVNVSRGVLYAGAGDDYALAAQREAASYHNQMRTILSEYDLS